MLTIPGPTEWRELARMTQAGPALLLYVYEPTSKKNTRYPNDLLLGRPWARRVGFGALVGFPSCQCSMRVAQGGAPIALIIRAIRAMFGHANDNQGNVRSRLR